MNNAQTFSHASDQYAKHRPQYPDELFAYLSELSPGHDSAWDCATGNGQAAISLAKFFARVEATDISAEQIAQGIAHPKVRYRISPAEHTPFADESFDLITVATAAHWFDQDQFHREVDRVLRPNGILAVWTYGYFKIECLLDEAIRRELLDPIDLFWAEGNRQVLNGYRDLTMPFEEIRTPGFSMQVEWNLEHFMAYAWTWSAVKPYAAEHGHDPVEKAGARLASLWGKPETVRVVKMPLAVRASRKGA